MSVFSSLLHGGMQYVAGFAAGGVFAAVILPQTFFISSYQRFYQMYNNGFEVKMDQHTAELAQEVLDAMKLKVEEEVRVKLFVAYGQELVCKGSMHTHQGGIVGVPANFKYQNVGSVERHKVVINNQPVNFDSKGGEMLEESMVLSKNAKKFAIARGVYNIKSYRLFIDASIVSLSVLGSYTAGFSLSRVMGLRTRFSAPVRGCVYTGIASLGYLFYVIVSDAYNCRQDRKLDLKAAKLSPEFAVGGVEYYTKLLQRNIAVRELLGSSGTRLYTAYGNEAQSWRIPKLSLTSHRDLLISLMNDYSKTKELDQNENIETL